MNSYVEFTMPGKPDSDQIIEEEAKEEEEHDATINLLTDSDDSDSEDMFVPEVLMDLESDDSDSDEVNTIVPLASNDFDV